jgi:twitching motility protein PilT
MVDWINRNQERVVVTIENPIEFTHASLKSIIKQRELGSDTLSYSQALQRSLRQDPDVIVVGELIDADCAMAALRAAETGHLVVSTVHAPDTEQTLERLVNLFPPEHAAAVTRQLASCLEAVLYQVLIAGKGDQRRVLASELLIVNYAVRHLIREQRFNRIANCIQTGRDVGMYTLQSRLEDLRRRGQIEESTVRDYAGREE